MIEVWIIQEGSRDILKLSKQEIFQSISTFSSSEEETYPPVDRHPDSVIVVQLLFLLLAAPLLTVLTPLRGPFTVHVLLPTSNMETLA